MSLCCVVPPFIRVNGRSPYLGGGKCCIPFDNWFDPASRLYRINFNTTPVLKTSDADRPIGGQHIDERKEFEANMFVMFLSKVLFFF